MSVTEELREEIWDLLRIKRDLENHKSKWIGEAVSMIGQTIEDREHTLGELLKNEYLQVRYDKAGK